MAFPERETSTANAVRIAGLLDALPVAAYAYAPDGSLVHYNESAAELWGQRPDVIGTGVDRVTHERAAPPHLAAGRAPSGDVARTENKIVFMRPDGCERTVLDYANSVLDASGDVIVRIGVLVDVTQLEQERRATEEGLRNSEARFRALFDNHNVGIVQVDGKGRFETVNDRYCELTGYSRSELLGMTPFDLDHPDDRPDDVARVNEVLADPSGVYRVEKRYVRKDGTTGWVHVSANMLRDEQSHPIQSAAIVLDISERKRAEEALQEADRKKDDFIATLAHELRNPLAPLMNAVELLRNPNTEPAWCRNLIERQIAHLTRLIDDLSDVSRIARDKLELRRDPVEVSDLIRSAVDASRSTVQSHAQRLLVDLPAENIYVDGDFVRLTQVLTNLLTNAAKFTDGPGTIRLRAAQSGGGVKISVADTGIGLDEVDLTRVFDKFYQSPRRGDRFIGGLGIGLSLVRRLVELHGGSVEARSEGIGRGSEFVVRLPTIGTPAEARSDAARPDQTSRRVLIIDDNVDSADSLTRLLKTLGHETATEYDGQSGLERAQTFAPEIVLLDLGMPGLDGFEVCRRLLHGGTSTHRPRVVAMTGWGRQEDRSRTLAAGFDAHLVKPVELSELTRMIEAQGTR